MRRNALRGSSSVRDIALRAAWHSKTRAPNCAPASHMASPRNITRIMYLKQHTHLHARTTRAYSMRLASYMRRANSSHHIAAAPALPAISCRAFLAPNRAHRAIFRAFARLSEPRSSPAHQRNALLRTSGALACAFLRSCGNGAEPPARACVASPLRISRHCSAPRFRCLCAHRLPFISSAPRSVLDGAETSRQHMNA